MTPSKRRYVKPHHNHKHLADARIANDKAVAHCDAIKEQTEIAVARMTLKPSVKEQEWKAFRAMLETAKEKLDRFGKEL